MAAPFIDPLVKYVGPTVALQEVLYGLIMALATTSTVSLAVGLGPESRNTLIFAAIGVNLAWGLADLAVYLVTKNFERLRRERLALSIRDFDGEDEDWSLDAIEEDLSETIIGTLDPADQMRIYQDVLESESRAVGPFKTYTKTHLLGGLSCLVITLLAALPVILSLYLIDPLILGFRIASVLSVGLLFVVGYTWAPYAGLRRWRTGLAMLLVGTAIMLSTIALGG